MSLSTAYDRPRPSASQGAGFAAALAFAAAALLVGTAMFGNRRHRQLARVHEFPDSAPATARRATDESGVASANVVAIRRPRAELYAFWRDFENLPRFMENVREVRVLGHGRSEWTIAGPAGTSVDVMAEIVDEREGERIAWRSLPESEVEAEGDVEFRDLPGGRGTAVEARVRYHPPGGQTAAWLAKLFQREPGVQGRRELRRLKMLMEAGEIATSANRRHDS